MSRVAPVFVLAALCLFLGRPSVAANEEKTIAMLGGKPDAIVLTAEEQQYLDLLNAARKAHKVPALIVAPLLVRTAREKSQEMHDLNYWGHESPNEAKRTALKRVLAALPERPETMTVGENLCLTGKIAVEAGHEALMKSPTHRKNILNPIYKYIGIGCYRGEDGRFWTTQHFLTITY